jgi:hypothetical protein
MPRIPPRSGSPRYRELARRRRIAARRLDRHPSTDANTRRRCEKSRYDPAMLWRLTQMASGVLGIIGLLAAQALVLYVLWWVVMLVVSMIPVIGKRHRHDRWDELNNGPGRATKEPSDRTNVPSSGATDPG